MDDKQLGNTNNTVNILRSCLNLKYSEVDNKSDTKKQTGT